MEQEKKKSKQLTAIAQHRRKKEKEKPKKKNRGQTQIEFSAHFTRERLAFNLLQLQAIFCVIILHLILFGP